MPLSPFSINEDAEIDKVLFEEVLIPFPPFSFMFEFETVRDPAVLLKIPSEELFEIEEELTTILAVPNPDVDPRWV